MTGTLRTAQKKPNYMLAFSAYARVVQESARAADQAAPGFAVRCWLLAVGWG